MDFARYLNKKCEYCGMTKKIYGVKPNAIHLCPSCDTQAIRDMTANGKVA